MVRSAQLSAFSFQRRVRKVPWYLTDQTCEVALELFEGPLGTQSSGLGSFENGLEAILCD